MLIDARRSLRYPTLFPGSVQIGADRLAVVIDDLSDEGAHVRLQNYIPVGSRMILAAKGLNVVGTVVRVTSRGYGLRLGTTINPLAVVRANIAFRSNATNGDAAPDQAKLASALLHAR